MSGPVHVVEHFDPEAPTSVVIAICGSTATISEDGSITPQGFDFVIGKKWGSRATCPSCIVGSELKAKPAAKTARRKKAGEKA